MLNDFNSFVDVDFERHQPPRESLRDGDGGTYTTLVYDGPFGYDDPRRVAMYTRADGTIVNDDSASPRTDLADRHRPPLNKWWLSTFNFMKWYALLTVVVVLGGDLFGGWSLTFLQALIAFNIGLSLLWGAFTMYTTVAIDWTYVDVSDQEITVRRRLRKPRTIRLVDVGSVEATKARWGLPVLRLHPTEAADNQNPFHIDYTRYTRDLMPALREHLVSHTAEGDSARRLLTQSHGSGC